MSVLSLAALLYTVVFPTCVNSEVRTETQRIAILRFRDRSGFRGQWELDREIPGLWARILTQDSSYVVIPLDRVEALIQTKKSKTLDARTVTHVGRILSADFLVTGTVEEYNLSRFTVGEPNLGGYKSYSASVRLGNVRLYRVLDGVELGAFESEKKITDRDLGLNLLGRLRDRDREFFFLDAIVFGSDRFGNTVIGMATFQALEELTEKLKGLVVLPPIRLPPDRVPILLSIQGNEGYIDIGSRDGVVVGHTFVVRAPTEVVGADTLAGTVRVTTVVSAHLSKVRILPGSGRIEPGYPVRAQE